MLLRKPHVSEIARVAGSKEKMVGLNGEVNASSVQDLMQSLVEIAKRIESGTVASHDEVSAAEAADAIAKVRAAYNDTNGGSWKELGAAIAAEVQETTAREGFMRSLLQKGTVAQGQEVRVRIHDKGMVAVVATGPGAVEAMYYRNKYAYPGEFIVSQNVSVHELEISKDAGNILEDAVMEAREAIMVTEDSTWKRLADTAVASGVNAQQTYVGGITIASMNATKSLVEGWGTQVTTLLMASDCIQDLTGSTFTNAMGPIAQSEIIMTGRLGTVLGMEIRTDAFRHRTLKVLNAGEYYFLAMPQFHGVFTDRQGITATETNGAQTGIPARGWYLWEQLSMITPNAASVAKGVRA